MLDWKLLIPTPCHIFVVPGGKEHLQHSIPWSEKIFWIRRYGIIKLSNWILLGRLLWKSLSPSSLHNCAKPFWVVLKIGLDLEKIFLQNGLLNTHLNSMKFHKFYDTEQTKSLFPRLCVESYILYNNFKSFQQICQ